MDKSIIYVVIGIFLGIFISIMFYYRIDPFVVLAAIVFLFSGVVESFAEMKRKNNGSI